MSRLAREYPEPDEFTRREGELWEANWRDRIDALVNGEDQ